MRTLESVKAENTILKILVVSCLIVVLWGAVGVRQMRQQMAEQNTRLIDLEYYEQTYSERIGYIIYDGKRKLVRAVSIDGGNSWFEVSEHREVLQPAYLHQRYPGYRMQALLAELEEVK